eukprot:54353-Amphidinium_carterae.1
MEPNAGKPISATVSKVGSICFTSRPNASLRGYVAQYLASRTASFKFPRSEVLPQMPRFLENVPKQG